MALPMCLIRCMFYSMGCINPTITAPKPDLRALRVSGKAAWVCPNCGAVNMNYLKGNTIALGCSDCERIYRYGLTLVESPKGINRKYWLSNQFNSLPNPRSVEPDTHESQAKTHDITARTPLSTNSPAIKPDKA
jgi:hypothetical protein